MRTLRGNDGFTLIELMIVVVIIGILAAIAIPRFTAVSDQAKQAEATPILRQICSLAEAERLRGTDWPEVDLSELPGWEDPQARYFTFSYAAGEAMASAQDANLADVTMNCADRAVTVGGRLEASG